MKLSGIAVSPGIAVGKAFIYRPSEPSVAEAFFDGASEEQLKRFTRAVDAADAELAAQVVCCGAREGKIFEAQREILRDEEISKSIVTCISIKHQEPGYAVWTAYAEFIALLEGARDSLIAARAADMRDVRNRLIRILQGIAPSGLSALHEPCVVVAKNLLPSDTAGLDRAFTLGIITETGGPTSHTAILANSFGIPAVAGVAEALVHIVDGSQIGLDAMAGSVYLSPDSDCLSALENKQKEFRIRQSEEERYLQVNPRTADGVPIEIGINIGAEEIGGAAESCDFVGLLRTEFLCMQSGRAPSEDEQAAAYTRVLKTMHGKPVTLRTLDIGGDKTLPWLPLAREENPFLGVRALRLCFQIPDLLRTQLRAALRASVAGPLEIMLPMVGSIQDIIQARNVFDSVREELAEEGTAMGNVKFGIMIEVPSIALLADLAADLVDFASIGSNDLCQYLMAADRMNSSMEAYYQPYSPAMVRLIAQVAAAFNQKGKPLAVCGELAGEEKGALLLVGLGVRRLSMSATRVARVKAALARHSLAELTEIAARAAGLSTEAAVLALLQAI